MLHLEVYNMAANRSRNKVTQSRRIISDKLKHHSIQNKCDSTKPIGGLQQSVTQASRSKRNLISLKLAEWDHLHAGDGICKIE